MTRWHWLKRAAKRHIKYDLPGIGPVEISGYNAKETLALIELVHELHCKPNPRGVELAKPEGWQATP